MTEKQTSSFSTSETSEISLRELWYLIIQYKWLILGIPILSIIAAFVITGMLKSQWEATAILQIGKTIKIGLTGRDGSLIWNIEPIEPIRHVIERMRLRRFQDEVLENSGSFIVREKPLEHLYHNSLKITEISNNLVELKVRGYSRQEATYLAKATADMICKIHNDMTKSNVQRLNRQLVKVKQQIENIQARQSHLSKIYISSADSREDQQLFKAFIISQQDREFNVLEQSKTMYEEQLNELNTFQTRLIADVFVDEKPVAPNKLLITTTMGLLSLFLAFFTAFFLNAINTK